MTELIEKMRIIASSKSWIEGEAVQQLKNSLELPGMQFVVGLPDLHPGKGNPVGAAFVSKGRLYPFLVGSDIGCGIGLWKTSLAKHKMKRDRWAKKLTGLEEPWSGDMAAWFEKNELGQKRWENSMGTIGGGNHFAELQSVESIVDETEFSRLGLDKDGLVLVVHSGSRGLGESVLREHVAKFGAKGVPLHSEEGQKYLDDHCYACVWAEANRKLIAQRFLDALAADRTRILDLCHNSVSVAPWDWEKSLSDPSKREPRHPIKGRLSFPVRAVLSAISFCQLASRRPTLSPSRTAPVVNGVAEPSRTG